VALSKVVYSKSNSDPLFDKFVVMVSIVAMSQFYKFNTSRPNIIVTWNITPKIELYCPTKEWIFKFLLLIVELILNAPLFFLYFPTCFSLCCICWMRQGHFTLDWIPMIYHEIFENPWSSSKHCPMEIPKGLYVDLGSQV
jgi:hypothetical protein